MRTAISATILALALTACGGDDGSSEAKPTASPTSAPATSEAATSEAPAEAADGPDCLVAAQKWADRMGMHVLTAATTAPGFAETINIDDTKDPTSEITVLCSEAITGPVSQANMFMAEANYELSLCALAPDESEGFGPTCPKPAAKKVRQLADKAAGYVGTVRNVVRDAS